jgi:hypothetical protein
MSSIRLLFYTTLLLLVGFTFSSLRDFGLDQALPWVVLAWCSWGVGLVWLRGRHGGAG